MFKWISLFIVLVAIVLYFTGALEVDSSGDSLHIEIDKEKAQELGESIKDKLED